VMKEEANWLNSWFTKKTRVVGPEEAKWLDNWFSETARAVTVFRNGAWGYL
jgi:hypothetical protein